MTTKLLEPITERYAKVLYRERVKIFADPNGMDPLVLSNSLGMFVYKLNPNLIADSFYTTLPDDATNTYLQPGKWDAENKCRADLQAAKARLESDPFKLKIEFETRTNTSLPIVPTAFTVRDALKDSPLEFIPCPKLGPYAMVCKAPTNAVEEELKRISTSFNFPLKALECNAFKDANKVLLGEYTIYYRSNKS